MVGRLEVLRSERDKIAQEVEVVHEMFEPGLLSAEGEEKIKNLISKIENINGEMALINKVDQMAPDFVSGGPPPRGAGGEETEAAAFRSFLKTGARNPNYGSLVQSSDPSRIMGAMGTTTDAAGGYLVPDLFYDRIEAGLTQYSPMRSAAEIIRTASGAEMGFPVVDVSAEKGSIVTENTAASAKDFSIGERVIPTYCYTSGIIPVTRQLLADSYYDVESFVSKVISIRIGAAVDQHLVSGTGTGQPQGIAAAPVGVTAASTTEITADELMELQHSVANTYRRLPGCGWLMKDSTLLAIRKLKNSSGDYIFKDRDGGESGGIPQTLWGHEIRIDDNMPAIGAGKKSIVFGSLSQYKIREVVGSFEFFRMSDSKYIERRQVGYIAFARFGGGLVDSGSGVKALKMATSK